MAVAQTPTQLTQARTDWLTTTCDILLDQYLMPAAASHGLTAPTYRVSVGPLKKGALAVCYPTARSEAGINEIIANQTLGGEDSQDLIACLLHELIHAVDDCQSGHKGQFADIALAIGFERPLTQLVSSKRLKELTQDVLDAVGPIPHDRVLECQRPKKPQNRHIKISCNTCETIIRASKTVIAQIDFSTAPCLVCEQTTLESEFWK